MHSTAQTCSRRYVTSNGLIVFNSAYCFDLELQILCPVVCTAHTRAGYAFIRSSRAHTHTHSPRHTHTKCLWIHQFSIHYSSHAYDATATHMSQYHSIQCVGSCRARFYSILFHTDSVMPSLATLQYLLCNFLFVLFVVVIFYFSFVELLFANRRLRHEVRQQHTHTNTPRLPYCRRYLQLACFGRSMCH